LPASSRCSVVGRCWRLTPHLHATTKKSTPTRRSRGKWGNPAVIDGFLRQPYARYLSPSRRIDWKQAGYSARQGDITPTLGFLKQFSKAMSDAGVPLVLAPMRPRSPASHRGIPSMTICARSKALG